MVKRNLRKKFLPALMTTGLAAELLEVTLPTVLSGCKRWQLGEYAAAPNNREFLLLRDQDVVLLSKKLQDGPGRKGESDV